MATLSTKIAAKKKMSKKTSLDMMMSEENSIDGDSSGASRQSAAAEGDGPILNTQGL